MDERPLPEVVRVAYPLALSGSGLAMRHFLRETATRGIKMREFKT